VLFFLLSLLVYGGSTVSGKKNQSFLDRTFSSGGCLSCHAETHPEKIPIEKDCSSCHTGSLAFEMKNPPPIPLEFPGVAIPVSEPVEGMVFIPGGAFTMGYDKRHPDEAPAHTVTLPGFYMDQYEVTHREYKVFAEETKRPFPDDWVQGRYPSGKDEHPVNFVTWYDAHDYCQWVNKRLPFEEEWEKAARGVDGRLFPWGNTFDPQKANTPQSKIGDTTPVGHFPEGKSPFGLYDMGGNVWEWTNSWAVAYPGNPRPKAHYYNGGYRVLRGGSWVDCSFYRCGISAFTFNRGYFKPETKNRGFGFRCAKSS